jgi:hypothetical protein
MARFYLLYLFFTHVCVIESILFFFFTSQIITRKGSNIIVIDVILTHFTNKQRNRHSRAHPPATGDLRVSSS